jgi:hypothetical protein
VTSADEGEIHLPLFFFKLSIHVSHNLSCLAVRVMLNQSKIYCRNWVGVDSILLVL